MPMIDIFFALDWQTHNFLLSYTSNFGAGLNLSQYGYYPDLK